jgi:hypothetical protein
MSAPPNKRREVPSKENGSENAHSRYSRSKHKKQMDLTKSWFEHENQQWEKTFNQPRKRSARSVLPQSVT